MLQVVGGGMAAVGVLLTLGENKLVPVMSLILGAVNMVFFKSINIGKYTRTRAVAY